LSSRPAWRQAYDAVERNIASPLEALVRTPEFARASALTARARRLVRDQCNDATAQLWHLANLPAGTDVQRLRVQVGQLDRELRRMRLQLAVQTQREVEEVSYRGADPDERA
jgi:hypothetical protein